MGILRSAATTLAGVGAAYFLDPNNGARRRALLRDRLHHTQRVLNTTALRDTHYLRNRAKGLVAEAKGRFRTEESDDTVVIERVRTKLGRVSSHAHAVEVYPKGKGVFELKGPIAANEHRSVIAAIRRVAGVKGIDDDLVEHDPHDTFSRHMN